MDAALLKKIQEDKQQVPKDKLDKINAMARGMRDLANEISDLETRTKEKKALLNKIAMEEMVALFEENRIPALTLAREGNYPSVELELKPYYKAVLPRDKETEQVLPAGPDWLEAHGHGDLIKRVFVIELPMGNEKLAEQLRKFLRGPLPKKKPAKKIKVKKGAKASPPEPQTFVPKFYFTEKRDVPWATLTAFVKEMIEKRKKALPLEILGALVGKVVKMKEVKEPK